MFSQPRWVRGALRAVGHRRAGVRDHFLAFEGCVDGASCPCDEEDDGEHERDRQGLGEGALADPRGGAVEVEPQQRCSTAFDVEQPRRDDVEGPVQPDGQGELAREDVGDGEQDPGQGEVQVLHAGQLLAVEVREDDRGQGDCGDDRQCMGPACQPAGGPELPEPVEALVRLTIR
jgi:hypothetical protein